MDLDDGVRQGYAVGVSLGKSTKDTVRLIFDDLELASEPLATWRQWSFFTFIDLSRERVEEHRLTQREYASIGEAILARLIALQSLDNSEA
jgi:hypothetical protein